ncbi:MAG: hypothetical protein LBF75_09075 [Treponema sp.]|nr:hypothetical protein [Treponema sp.]
MEERGTSLRSYACGGRYEGRRRSEERRTSLRSYILRRVLTYIVGLAPKRQTQEARGAATAYHHCPLWALNPLGGACGERYEGRRRLEEWRTSLRSYILRSVLTYIVGLAPKP